MGSQCYSGTELYYLGPYTPVQEYTNFLNIAKMGYVQAFGSTLLTWVSQEVILNSKINACSFQLRPNMNNEIFLTCIM